MIAEIKLWGTLVGYLSDDAENAIHFTYDPSFVSRGMGALEYHPHLDNTLSESSEIRIEDIANAAKHVLKRRSDATMKPEIGRLHELIKIGSSAGGA